MKTSIAIYNSHEEAISAVVELKENGFPMEKVSLMGKADITEDKIHVRENKKFMGVSAITGTVLGTTIGLLTGIGLLAIPGFGFLFGAGAVVGAFGGFDVGLLAGGLGALLLNFGIKNDFAVKYDEHLSDGKFLLMINGAAEEVEEAKQITGQKHLEYHIHELRRAA